MEVLQKDAGFIFDDAANWVSSELLFCWFRRRALPITMALSRALLL